MNFCEYFGGVNLTNYADKCIFIVLFDHEAGAYMTLRFLYDNRVNETMLTRLSVPYMF